jgi:hypothetical protein
VTAGHGKAAEDARADDYVTNNDKHGTPDA